MPIRADQLKEKEDYQKLILDSLHDNNGFRIRPNTEYKPGLAMDIGMLLEFLESPPYVQGSYRGNRHQLHQCRNQ